MPGLIIRVPDAAAGVSLAAHFKCSHSSSVMSVSYCVTIYNAMLFPTLFLHFSMPCLFYVEYAAIELRMCQWKTSGTKIRVPNSILTILLKQWFPGIVKFKGKDEPAWTWKHYRVGPDSPEANQIRLPSRLHRVEEDFWLYFRWAEGTEQRARKVVHNCVRGLFQVLFYETRILAVLNYQRKFLKMKTSRSIACRTYLTEEYLKVEPWWFMRSKNAWRQLIQLQWCNPEWQAISNAHRIRREKK
uniref:Uncharacterized protein n=1 Tax=Oryza brachyantha TaxID=4533 RepID=J3M5E6_ORYBR